MNKCFFTLCRLCFLSLALLVICGAIGHSRVQGNFSPSPVSWMTQAWTGDDAPYRQIETNIDQRIARGEAVSALTQEYKGQAENHQSDPKAQFAWAYTVHTDAAKHHGIVPADALSAITKTDPGNVYRYARLRFLLTRETAPNNDHADLEAVGLRLLARDSQDEMVHKNLVYDLDTRSTVAKALKYAKAWVAQQPNSAGAHAVLASVYDSLFAYSHRNDYASAKQVVAEYQKYQSLAPPNDPFRRHLVYVLQYYQTVLKNHH